MWAKRQHIDHGSDCNSAGHIIVCIRYIPRHLASVAVVIWLVIVWGGQSNSTDLELRGLLIFDCSALPLCLAAVPVARPRSRRGLWVMPKVCGLLGSYAMPCDICRKLCPEKSNCVVSGESTARLLENSIPSTRVGNKSAPSHQMAGRSSSLRS